MTDYDPLSNAEWRAFQAAQQFERNTDLAADCREKRCMDESLKFCVDCQHVIQPEGGLEKRCGKAPKSINLVTGEATAPYCVTARTDGAPCGPTGKLFEPKKP